LLEGLREGIEKLSTNGVIWKEHVNSIMSHLIMKGPTRYDDDTIFFYVKTNPFEVELVSLDIRDVLAVRIIKK
jgi:hypothetical protein